MTFKRLISWFIGFLILVCIGDRLIGWALQQLLQQSHFRYVQMYDGQQDADIIIVGNSRGVNGFYQPEMQEILGKKVFNISYNGLRMDIAKVLIEDYLEYNASPKTIILEASVLTKAYPSLLREFKTFAKPGSHLKQAIEQNFPRLNKQIQLSHIYRYNSELFLRSLYYLNKSDQSWINRGVISDELIASLAAYNGKGFDYVPELIEDLNTIQHLCRQKGIKLKIILSPYLPQYIQKSPNLSKWLATVNQAIDGNTILNYSSVIEGKTYFADWVHLNEKGSSLFLQYMIEQQIFE